MTLEQNETKLHQKYFVADLGSEIRRNLRVVFMKLVHQSARVLQICPRLSSQISVSLSCDFVL